MLYPQGETDWENVAYEALLGGLSALAHSGKGTNNVAKLDSAIAKMEKIMNPESIKAGEKAEPIQPAMVTQGEQMTTDTKAISKPIGEYSTEKQSVLRAYLAAVDDNIKNFVQRVKEGDLTFKRQKISDVSERAAADIGELLNIDVSGYTHNINTNGVQHIINRHGESGKQDTSMAVEDDIARIGWVLDNYDSVDLLTEKGKQIHSSEFLDMNQKPAPQIRFIKKIDGTYYVVESVFENGHKKLWVQSAYLQKNEDVTQTPAEGMSTNHETNAQSASASPSSNNSISENGQIVNAADGAVNRGRKVGWDGREVVTEAKGKSVTIDGVKYEFLGYDANGSPVYQDAEVLKEQSKQSEEKTKQADDGKPAESEGGQNEVENSEDRDKMKIGIQFFAEKTQHANERIEQRNLPETGVDDALANPLHKGDIIVDDAGRKSVKYIGKDITVVLNPDTGEVITAWKTGTRIRRKYGGN